MAHTWKTCFVLLYIDHLPYLTVCAPCRQSALQELAGLLLTFLCTPATPVPITSASPPMTPRLPPPSQVTIDIPANDPVHVTIRMPSPHGTATPTPSTTRSSAVERHRDSQVWCDLACIITAYVEVVGMCGLISLPTIAPMTEKPNCMLLPH